MQFQFRNHRPSCHQQLTAALAALLVMVLAALSANSELHARLHDHGGVAVKGGAGHAGHADQQPGHDDDGCVVVTFANGIVLASLGLMVIAALGRTVDSILREVTAGYRQALRYWLPPLCGPPLS